MQRVSLTSRLIRCLPTAALLAAAATFFGVVSDAPVAAHVRQQRPKPFKAICHRVSESARPLHLRGRRRLTILATGDSMIYPVDQELKMLSPLGVRVVADRHDGTGLSTDTVNWRRLSERQAERIRPDVTVISLGGRDGGVPLPDASHHLVECCGNAWLVLYASLVRPLVHAYLRHGDSRVYWLLLPAPRETARAPLFAAVNDALRLLAPEFDGRMRLIPTDAVISPGGYQDTITYAGLKIYPRVEDGIHVDHAGACVEVSLVAAGLRADGLLGIGRPM